MAVMRSIMYVPGNNPKMVEKLPASPPTSLPSTSKTPCPRPKGSARKLVAEKLKYAGSAALRCTSASTTGKPK